MWLLLIEDDQETADYLSNRFLDEEIQCDATGDGRSGLRQALKGNYDLLIVDRMLPSLDGLSLVRQLRSSQVTTPVIYLTSLGEVDDRVDGLRAGGDDYLVKPFVFEELSARVHALLRRSVNKRWETTLRVADLELDRTKKSVHRGGRAIYLQEREFRLLEFLMQNSEKVLTRAMIMEQVWNLHFDPHTNIVEARISRLRAKIDKPFDVPLIHTVRSLGYSLQVPEEDG